MTDSTTPKDTAIQEDELSGNQPEECNKDTPTGGLLKPEQPPSQEIGDETHTPGEPKSTHQGYSSDQPTGQPEEQRQALGLHTKRVNTSPIVEHICRQA